ncbi:ankyrin repeat and socs box protein 17 [Holotrichia oblita]|uniref:Ankyrin repeat and socs box protein 17 n=1 Tax=Holotrichia oblita TaxID=644536 RepID=A0ACB9TB09_HOLOL|nr:ankyrin repeat and socs box protein 17 [Holotrichia oblita]
MDVILSCFFENFEETERNSLHARYKRRAMVEYFNTLIEGCRLGKECDPQVIVREAIIGILRYHEDARSKNGGVCLMGKYHDVLYVAIRLCYDWQLKDSQTIASLLDEIYSCENTFERILIGALFGTRAPHYIAGWKSDFENQEDNVRAMVYYLDHAMTANLEYKYGPDRELTRYIDIPIESCGKLTSLKIAIQLGLPDKLHILLRFGALVTSRNDEDPIVVWLLDKLTEYTGCYPYNFVSCLQLLCRVLPNISPKINHVDHQLQRQIILEKYNDLINHGIMPLNRCGVVPAELKHLSRCVIRKVLWENYDLPNAIRKLPIPERLHKYLDLLED